MVLVLNLFSSWLNTNQLFKKLNCSNIHEVPKITKIVLNIGLGEAKEGLDIRRMTLQEISFIGTYTYTAQDFKDTAKAIFEGRLGPLNWTDIRPLKEGQSCFDEILNGKSSSPKIILQP